MMLLNPSVIALVVLSISLAGITLAASLTSIGALARWRSHDDSEDQLAREQRMLLVEMTMGVVLVLEIASVLAFIWVVDRLHAVLPGAMCAAGSLASNGFGYFSLAAKLAAFIAVSLWWMVHRESRAAISPGLVRVKHLALPGVALILTVDCILQWRYFSALRPDVMTSCCATIFRESAEGLGGFLAAISPQTGQILFFSLIAATGLAGARLLKLRSRPWIFSILAGITAAAGIVALVSWIAPAFYEAPTHHCPFCLLKRDAGYVGYLLYPALSLALLAGLGSGVVRGLRPIDRFGAVRDHAEMRLCRVSLTAFLLFTMIAIWPLATSDLHLGLL